MQDGHFTIERHQRTRLAVSSTASIPPADVIDRSSIMTYFDDVNRTIRSTQMWITVRCFDISKAPWWSWILILRAIVSHRASLIRRFRNKGVIT